MYVPSGCKCACPSPLKGVLTTDRDLGRRANQIAIKR